jgi:hypothetical protein
MQRYPLAWPAGWKRTEPGRRTRAKFGRASSFTGSGDQSRYVPGRNLTMSESTTRCLGELRRMGVQDGDHVISTNVVLRLDGLPRSDQRAPTDPGVAVYWIDRGARGSPQRCMAVDHYDRVEDNLAAIAATLEAMRAIERHGGAAILDRAFTGFTALPPPMAAGKPWREVFGFQGERVTQIELQGAYRTARSEAHPDKGGLPGAFQAVQDAYEQACRELGFKP